MKKIFTLFIFILFVTNGAFTKESEKLKALIVTGQCSRAHNWKVSSQHLKNHLNKTKLFNIDFAISPPKGDNWSDKTLSNFTKYIHSGGGVVFVHTAFSAINGSKEFDEIVGLRSFGFDSLGMHVYWENGKIIKDRLTFKAGIHHVRHDFMITIRDFEHPITKGLPVEWMHPSDDLYAQLRGSGKNIRILATAYSDPQRGNMTTGKHEPLLFTVRYGKGRILVCVLGHVGLKEWTSGFTEDSMLCAGFITVFQRGAEWAASSKVSQLIPDDFPTAKEISIRKIGD